MLIAKWIQSFWSPLITKNTIITQIQNYKGMIINHKYLFYIINYICNLHQVTSDTQFHQSIHRHGDKIIYVEISAFKFF